MASGSSYWENSPGQRANFNFFGPMCSENEKKHAINKENVNPLTWRCGCPWTIITLPVAVIVCESIFSVEIICIRVNPASDDKIFYGYSTVFDII